MPHARVYSPYNRKATALLGQIIHLYRKEKKWTAHELAERAGISRTTLQKIEKGDMKCEIGIVFEVAALVGIKLFEADSASLDSMKERLENKLTLLPKRIRTTKMDVNDEF